MEQKESELFSNKSNSDQAMTTLLRMYEDSQAKLEL